jgi:HEAT repeat protein
VRVLVQFATGLLVAAGVASPLAAQFDWELSTSPPTTRPIVDPRIVGRWKGGDRYSGAFLSLLGEVELQIWSFGLARVQEFAGRRVTTIYELRARDGKLTLKAADGSRRSGSYEVVSYQLTWLDHTKPHRYSLGADDPRFERMDRVEGEEGTASSASRPSRATPIDDLANVSGLVALASDPTPGYRELGLFRLASIAVEKPEIASAVVPTFMRALTDQTPGVASLAADALGNLGPSASAAVTALIQTLRSDSADLRERSARALGRIAAKPDLTAPALIAMISDPDARTRVAVVEALGNFGSMGVGTFATALSDPCEEVSRCAIESLKKLGPQAAAAVPALILALREGHSSRPPPKSLFDALGSGGDGYLRRGAAETLAKIGPAARPAVPSLIEALESRPTVATTAAAVLSAFPDDAAISVPAIAKVLDRWPVYMPQWRQRIIDALGAFGRSAAVAAPTLMKVIQDEAESPRVREAAERAREKILGK